MDSDNTFIGVDLAWKSDTNHSGVVVAQGSSAHVGIKVCSQGLDTLQRVLDYVISHTTDNTVVAIDAPLVIANQNGQRPCETSIGQRFGAQHASAHTSNLNLYPNAGSTRFASMLISHGFTHNPRPAEDRLRPGKWIFEVYPHPAQIVLFGLERIIKYKKGTVAQKRVGLRTLRKHIGDHLKSGTPSFEANESFDELLTVDVDALRGKALKQYEDKLDACFCAYLALFYWYWGGEKNELIGDISTGYIINPTEAL